VKGMYTNINSDAHLLAKATGTQAGGTIETSGNYLYVSPKATINASSENGLGGTWVIDPLYVTITNTLPSGKKWDNSFTYKNDSNSAAYSYVQADQISSILTAGTGVTVTAEDEYYVADIFVESPITKTGGNDVALTLKAQQEVRLDADVKSTSGKLNIVLWSDSAGQKSGAVILNADLDSHGGDITTGSGTNITDGTVGTYIGITEAELNKLIASDTRTDRNIITYGGALKMYGDVLLATGDYTNFNTVAADGKSGGSVLIDGRIDSGNFYKAIKSGDGTNVLTWDKARKLAYTNSQGITTTGGADIWDSYLTNITSELENSVVASTFEKTSENTAYFIGAYTKNISTLPRTWYWADGPEAGKTFYQQTAGKGAKDPHGTTDGMDYTYNKWHSGEPNNDGSQDIATIGYGWDAKWDDNVAGNRVKNSVPEIPGYIQETNMVRTALKINSGKGDVEVTGKIGSQRTLWELDVNNTGNVTFGGSVQLSDDYYRGTQFYSDMNIHSAGNVTMKDFVDATGNINIGYDKDGSTIATGAVKAFSTLTAENGNVVIGSSAGRSASALLMGQVTAGAGVAIYTSGNVESDTGILAKGNDNTALGSGLATSKVAGNVVINASTPEGGPESKITLKGTTTVGSSVDTKDDITLYGDKMDLQGPVTTNGTTGVVTVSNYTKGNTIDLGSAVDKTANTLELSDSEIDNITASKLVVGNNDSTTATKNINITDAITPKGTSVVHMYTGDTGGQIKETTDTGTLAPGDSGTLNLAITADTQVYLDNANNVTKFAATSTGDTTNDTIRFNNGENTLTVDTVDGVSGVTSDVTGNSDAVILATHKNFVNNVGPTAVSVPSDSRWRIFSYSPTPSTFGPGDVSTYLISGSNADWSTTYAKGDTVGTNVVDGKSTKNEDDSYNHYIFAVTPTLVLTPIDTTKDYGTDLTSYKVGKYAYNYTILGNIYDEVAVSDIDYFKDKIKTVTLSSNGLDKTANVGIYKDLALDVTWVDGESLLDTTHNGYKLSLRTGNVTVKAIPLVIEVAGTRKYGETKSGDTFTNTTYTINDSDRAVTNGLMDFDKDNYTKQVHDAATYKDNTLPSTAVKTSYTSKDGTYLTIDTATQAADVLKNYIVTYSDTYTITPADLTINVTAERGYGETKNATTGLFDTATYTVDNSNVAKGLKSWDATAYNAAINNGASKLVDTTLATTDKGTYTDGKIVLTDAVKNSSVLSNYNVTYTNKYIIDPAALTITTTGSKTYGDADPATSTYKVVASGWKNSDESSLWTTDNQTAWKNTLSNSTSATSDAGNYGSGYSKTQVLSYNPTVDMTTKLSNYAVTYVDKFTINAAPLDVTVTGNKKYGTTSSTNPSDYSFTTGAGQLRNSETITPTSLTIANTVSTTDNVGSYYNNYTGANNTTDNAAVSGTLTGASGFKASNYTIKYHTKYDVEQTPLDIIVLGSKEYGNASSTNPSDYSFTTGAGQLRNSETITPTSLTIANTVSTTDNVGSYYNNYTGANNTTDNAAVSGTLTGASGFDAANYAITYHTKYDVTKAPLDITVTGSKEYGETSSTSIGDYTATANTAQLKNSNTVNLDGLTLTNSVSTTDNVGSYYNNYTGETNTTDNVAVTGGISGGAGFDINNYDVAYHTKYDVTKAPLDITITGTKIYGDASSTSPSDYTFTTVASQLKNGEDITPTSLTLVNSVATGANVGSYYKNYPSKTDTTENVSASGTLIGTGSFKDSNYAITYHSKYDVTPAPLTITASSYVLGYGDAIPALIEKYAGFKNGDTAAILNDDGLYTTATSLSPQGKYPVDFTGSPNNSNYVITLIPGTIYINPKAPDPHENPNPPTTPTTPTAPTNPMTNNGTKIPPISGVNDGGDSYGGFDRNVVREAMPVYTVQGTKTTRVGAYNVADSATGVRMHATMDTVADPADDKTESRTTTVKYTKDNLTGTFNVVFDGSIVKVYPEDAASKRMVAETKDSRYLDIYRGALNTALNDMGVILQSVRGMYLML
jgi:hypothetical protein